MAGSREPCFDRRSKAGLSCTLYGGEGFKYSARRIWYVECVASSVLVFTPSLALRGEERVVSCALCTRLQYLSWKSDYLSRGFVLQIFSSARRVLDLLFCFTIVLHLEDVNF